MRRLGLSAAIALPFLIYLAAWPVPVEPVAWTPPASPGYTGPYAANRALAAAERLDVGGEGPEDVAVGRDGAVFTGLRDGRIVRLDPQTLRAATFAVTGGRPLGLRFAPDGRLLIADAERGLLAAAPDGSVTVLASGHAGRPLRLTDDVDVAGDGTVYFSVASERFAVDDSVADVVEHRTTGRLFAYDPATRSTKVLLEGLCFANGVALAPDESYVLVVETACYRVRRFWLRGERAGASEVVVDGLPGFPDGILGDGEGTFWLTLVSPRNALLDALHPHPAFKKALARLPAAIRPGPKAYGMVVALSGEGVVRGTLQDPDGQNVAFVTNAVPSGPWLYLGMLKGHAVARLPRPARYSSPMTPKSMEPASR